MFSGACPSFLRETCLGCRSENKSQKRISKWSCELRKCCHEKMALNYCIQCKEYPCKNLVKLRNSHLDDERFEYRHKIFYNLVDIKKIGIDNWLEEQREIWTCSECGGTVAFYENKCHICGMIYQNVFKNYNVEDENE